jgi:hypothetical protein
VPVFAGASKTGRSLTPPARDIARLAKVGSLQQRRGMRSVLVLAVVAACNPSAYAPPARFIALDSPTAPHARGTDVQAEIGRIGTMWGPDLAAGNLRARHAVSDSVVIEAETGMASVENEGTVVANDSAARTTTSTTVPVSHVSSDSHDAFTGRAGAILQGTDGKIRGALSAGIGGGYSPVAGGWTSVDVGASAGSTHPWIRPWASGELGYNQPVGARQFAVQYGDGDDTDQTTLEMTSNLMARGTLGLELGPIERAFVVGMSVMRVFADTNGVVGTGQLAGDDVFIAVAAGFRAQL